MLSSTQYFTRCHDRGCGAGNTSPRYYVISPFTFLRLWINLTIFSQVYPAVMLEILRTNDMQLLVIALSCTMQALETLNSADTSDNTRALSILVTLACDDEFYNVIGVIMENGNVDATRDIALEILVLLDRVRSIHGE